MILFQATVFVQSIHDPPLAVIGFCLPSDFAEIFVSSRQEGQVTREYCDS